MSLQIPRTSPPLTGAKAAAFAACSCNPRMDYLQMIRFRVTVVVSDRRTEHFSLVATNASDAFARALAVAFDGHDAEEPATSMGITVRPAEAS